MIFPEKLTIKKPTYFLNPSLFKDQHQESILGMDPPSIQVSWESVNSFCVILLTSQPTNKRTPMKQSLLSGHNNLAVCWQYCISSSSAPTHETIKLVRYSLLNNRLYQLFKEEMISILLSEMSVLVQ